MYNCNMIKKIQVLTVHGGMTFKNQKDYIQYLKNKKVSVEKKVSWAGEYLEKSLGKNFQVISPKMPLQDNAKYQDWKIVFEQYLAVLHGKFVLIGSSLGGIFLAKYLSEHKLPKKALSVFLVCPPFDNTLPGEDLVGGFALQSNLSLVEKNAVNLYLLFSKDDDVVPVTHVEKYKKKLPKAKIIIYKSKKGHFLISKFPEIITMIKKDAFPDTGPRK